MSGVDFNKLEQVRVSDAPKRTFAVVGKDLTEKQAKAGYYLQIKKGTKLDGFYNGSMIENQFNTEEIRLADENGNETIIKSCASLRQQLAKIEIGSPVRLIYNGLITLKKGPRKGKEMHDWQVLA